MPCLVFRNVGLVITVIVFFTLGVSHRSKPCVFPQSGGGGNPRGAAHCGDGDAGSGSDEDGEEESHHQEAAHRRDVRSDKAAPEPLGVFPSDWAILITHPSQHFY